MIRKLRDRRRDAAPTAASTERADAEDSFKYDAFLSYSQADGDVAKAVQHGLHRLAKKLFSVRARRIYRDRTHMTANPGLWSELRTALDQSKSMVFLASPSAAAPDGWPDRELSYWVESRGTSRLILVRTAGAIVWDPTHGCFGAEATTALPPALLRAGVFRELPTYVDLADLGRDPDALDIRSSAFRERVIAIAATIDNVVPADLDSQDVRDRRLLVRLRNSAIAVFAVLTLAAIGFAIAAANQADRANDERDRAVSAEAEATEQRDQAERLADEADARRLAVSAESVLDRDPALAALLAVESSRAATVPETTRALHAVFSTWQATVPHEAVAVAGLSPDGGRIVSAGGSGATLWEVADQTSRALDLPGAIRSIRFDPTGSKIAAAGDEGVMVLDLDEPGAAPRVLSASRAETAAFDSTGDSVVAAGDGGVIVWDLGDGSERELMASAGEYWADFDPANPRIVSTGPSGLLVWDDSDGGSPELLSGSDAQFRARFSPDGSRVLTTGDFGVLIWDAEFGADPVRLTASSFVRTAEFSSTSETIVSAGLDGVFVWTDESGIGDTYRTRQFSSVPWQSAALDQDDIRMITVGTDTVVLWNLESPDEVAPISSAWAKSAAFDSSEERVLLVDAGGISIVDLSLGGQVSDIPTGVRVPTSAALSADDSMVAIARSDGVEIRTVVGFDLVTRIDSGTTRSVAFDPSGRRVLTAGDEGVHLWDLMGGDERTVVTVDAHDSAQFDPSGTSLLLAGDSGISEWTIDGDIARTANITTQAHNSASFDSSGDRIVASSDDGAAIWSRDQRTVLRILTTDATSTARFDRAGDRIVMAGPNGSAVATVTESNDMRTVLERRLGDREFTLAECSEYLIDPCPAEES